MKKPLLQTPRNFSLSKEHKTKVQGESMTVPNMSYTIQEILEKSVRGMNLDNLKRDTYFSEDPSLEDPTENDFQDLTDLDEANAYLDMISERVEILEKEKQKRMYEDARKNDKKE